MKMKLLFLTIIILSILTSCTTNKAFNATILEIRANSVLVEPLEGQDIRSAASRIVFMTDHLEKIAVSVGDVVTVQYDGLVRVSSPAGIDTISWSIYIKSDLR